jgi:hypothetical protein
VAINVLNTDAGLSGKTIVNLEDAQTVTGLKTFDRDPNAPFAVSAASAVVTNLDADKLDGLEGSAYYVKATDGATGTYVPTWANITVGNGTNSGNYHQIGKLIIWSATLQCGTTTSWTAATVTGPTLPTGLAATTSHIPAFTARGYIFDSSGTAYHPLIGVASSTSGINLATTASPAASIADGTPVTIANGDVIAIGGFYYIA